VRAVTLWYHIQVIKIEFFCIIEIRCNKNGMLSPIVQVDISSGNFFSLAQINLLSVFYCNCI
jgi:hypothetical protein